MTFTANPGKQVNIEVGGRIYARQPIQVPFVQPGDDLLQLGRDYVAPLAQPGDLLAIGAKVVSLCQGRVLHRQDLPITLTARLLSQFAQRHNSAGIGVGEPIKMQYALRTIGLPRVLLACAAGAWGKLTGQPGLFYQVTGLQVSGLDGFYAGVWEAYRDLGIELPAHPDQTCDQFHELLGISCFIIDANDFGQTILGHSHDLHLPIDHLRALVRDNPAGQGQQRTPFILIRPQKMAA